MVMVYSIICQFFGGYRRREGDEDGGQAAEDLAGRAWSLDVRLDAVGFRHAEPRFVSGGAAPDGITTEAAGYDNLSNDIY